VSLRNSNKRLKTAEASWAEAEARAAAHAGVEEALRYQLSHLQNAVKVCQHATALHAPIALTRQTLCPGRALLRTERQSAFFVCFRHGRRKAIPQGESALQHTAMHVSACALCHEWKPGIRTEVGMWCRVQGEAWERGALQRCTRQVGGHGDQGRVWTQRSWRFSCASSRRSRSAW